MKMLKAVKKLKLWSRKRKRKSLGVDFEPSYPYSPHCHCCYSRASAQPSAPPLPSWLQAELTEEDAIPPPTLLQFPTQDDSLAEIESHRLISPGPGPGPAPSYQQYMVPNPVHGLPVVAQEGRRERSAGFLGCVIDFGLNFIRCFCPCFRIREQVCRQL